MHTSDISSIFNASHTIHPSQIPHKSHTSYTSHTSHISDTPHLSHTHHTSHASYTSSKSQTSTHHITPRTPTTPAFAVATLECLTDDELRALGSNSEDARLFCPLFLEYQSQIFLPTYVSQFGRSQIESACSCFDVGYGPGGGTAPTVSTEADLVSTSTALSSSAIASTSLPSRSSSITSTSTAGGSAIQGNRSSSASFTSPGRFAIILLSVLVIFPVMAWLNDV